MPLSDESVSSLRERVDTAAMQVHLGVILGFIDVCRTKKNPEDISGALDLLASTANMVQTLVQDLDVLLQDREELVQTLCDYADHIRLLEEKVKIYDDLEKVRSGHGQKT